MNCLVVILVSCSITVHARMNCDDITAPMLMVTDAGDQIKTINLATKEVLEYIPVVASESVYPTYSWQAGSIVITGYNRRGTSPPSVLIIRDLKSGVEWNVKFDWEPWDNFFSLGDTADDLRLYIGHWSESSMFGNILKFDSNNKKFTKIGSKPEAGWETGNNARGVAGITMINGKYCLVGSAHRNYAGREIYDSRRVLCYYKTIRAWRQLNVRLNRHRNEAVQYYDTLYVCGSHNSGNNCLVYNLTTGKLMNTVPISMGYKRHHFKMYIASDEVHIVGMHYSKSLIIDCVVGTSIQNCTTWNLKSFNGLILPCQYQDYRSTKVHTEATFRTTVNTPSSKNHHLGQYNDYRSTTKVPAEATFRTTVNRPSPNKSTGLSEMKAWIGLMSGWIALVFVVVLIVFIAYLLDRKEANLCQMRLPN